MSSEPRSSQPTASGQALPPHPESADPSSSVNTPSAMHELSTMPNRETVESSRLSVVTFAPDGRARGANAAWEELWIAPAASLADYNVLEDTQLAGMDLVPFVQRAFAGEAIELTPFWYEPGSNGRPGRGRWVHTFFQTRRDAGGAIAEVLWLQHDVTELKHSEDALRFLTGIGNALAGSLNDEKILQNIADLAVPYLADACFVDTLEANGALRRMATAPKTTPPRSDTRATPTHLTQIETADLVVVRRVLDNGQAQVWNGDDTQRDSLLTLQSTLLASRVPSEHGAEFPDRELLRATGAVACLCVPLRAGDDVLGTMTFLMGEESAGRSDAGENSRYGQRRYDAARIVIAEELAARAALSLDNARLCRQAQEANLAKDEFLSVAAHELRTPLTSLLGWTHLMMDNRLDDPGRDEAAQSIERNAWTLVQLVNDIVDTARISAGRVQLNWHLVNLVVPIEAALTTARASADAKNIELHVEFDAALGPIHGDAVRVQQVIWILLSNAIKFSPPNARIDVHLEQARDESGVELARLIVRDQGSGIDPEFLPFIWERWARSSHRLTRQHSGLGLGLSNARYLVEMHGGRVRAQSEGIGRGATFIVELPLPARSASVPLPPRALRSNAGVANGAAPDAETEAAIRQSVAGDLAKLANAKVLVVAEPSRTHDEIETAIAHFGAHILDAATVAQALELIASERPDILVADIAMPGEDGYALIRRVRALPEDQGRNTPAVAITSHPRTLDRLRALSSGYQHHFARPLDPSECTAIIAALLPEKR